MTFKMESLESRDLCVVLNHFTLLPYCAFLNSFNYVLALEHQFHWIGDFSRSWWKMLAHYSHLRPILMKILAHHFFKPKDL